MLWLIMAGLILALLVGLGITQVLTLNWTRSGEAITASVTGSSSGEINIDETVPGSGNIVLDFALDVSAVSLVYLLSTGDIVLTANDDGSPDATITLKANIPCIWYTNCGLTTPLGIVDWTTMKATKATATDATLKMRFQVDVSP